MTMRRKDRLVLAKMVRILRADKDCIAIPLEQAAELEGFDPKLVRGIDERKLWAPSFGGSALILPHVSVGEIEGFDKRVRHFDSDVMDLVGGMTAVDLALNVTGAVALYGTDAVATALKWSAFYASWRAWDKDHYGEWSRSGEAVRQEFDAFAAQYNEQLRAFKARYPGRTTATEQPAASTGEGGGLGSAVDKITTLALVGVGAYIAFQALQLMRGK